jgi:DNA-binding transcriptional ArsR family regulator
MQNKELPHNHGDVSKVLQMMPEDSIFQDMADTLNLLSDGTRLKIFWLLCHSEECVCNIASAVDMSAPAVSHHLRILKQAGLLHVTRKGKEIHYRIADTEQAVLLHYIVDKLLHIQCSDS